MSAIIVALLAILGPIIGKFLADWLAKLLNKVAPSVQRTGDDRRDAVAMVQAAHDATKPRQFLRRALLRRVKDHAADIAEGVPLTKADALELANLAGGARRE